MNHDIARAIRRKFGTKVQGHFSPIPTHEATREALCDLWGELGYLRGVEIGVMTAGFSLQILSRNPACHLICIDPWCEYKDSNLTAERQERHYGIARDKLKPFTDSGRCEIWRRSSLDAFKSIPDGSLDFVFIDGDHSFDGCAQDLIFWCPKVRKGGMIAVHDYCPMVRGGVLHAVDAYTFCHHIEPWYVLREALPTAFWVQT